MELTDYLKRRVVDLEEDFLTATEQHDYDAMMRIAYKRQDVLDELYSLVATEQERIQEKRVLYELSSLSHQMRLDCQRLKDKVARDNGVAESGSVVGDLFVIEMESDENGPVNHFDTDELYGSDFNEMPDWILHTHRAHFHITTLDHVEIRVDSDSEWVFEGKSPTEINDKLSELGFSKADIARLMQIRMKISYTTEKDTIINNLTNESNCRNTAE